MSAPHDERHRELIERVVTGDLAPGAPLVIARIEHCPRCREELIAMTRVIEELDAVVRVEPEFVEEVRSQVTETDRQQVRAFLRSRLRGNEEEVEEDGPGRQGRVSVLTRMSRWGAAAMLVVVAGLVLFQSWGDDPGSDGTLGGGGKFPAHPVGEVEEFDRFEIDFDLPDGGYFVIRVFDPETDEERGKAEHVESNGWQPGEPLYSSWPDSIRWEWVAYDATGIMKEFDELEATRPSSED